jgi:Lon protease-like protein
MATELLPLFPLNAVLFPRTHLPLHIFEERYKQLINECLERRSEFGVVLAAEDGVVQTGCTAVVERVARRYPDGRMDILVIGVRRFEIESLDTEKPYLRGRVRFFNDEETETVSERLKELAVAGYRALAELATGEPTFVPEWDDPQLSFQLAQAIQDIEFRQTLLLLRSETERLRRLIEFFPIEAVRQRHAAHIKGVAPRNGRGWHPSIP